MKTEEQIVNKLELMTEELQKLVADMDKAKIPTEDHKIRGSVLMGMLCFATWVINCEEMMKPVLLQMKLQGIADVLSKLDFEKGVADENKS